MLGIVDSGWWWYMEIYYIHLCFDVFGNFHNKKRFLFWVELENITSADWKTRLLESFSVANTGLWKSLNTCLFTRWKLFEGSDCILFIFLMPHTIKEMVPEFISYTFCFRDKNMYDYNVFLMSWPLVKYPLLSQVTDTTCWNLLCLISEWPHQISFAVYFHDILVSTFSLST